MTWTWTEIMSLALVRSGIVGRGQVASASNFNDALDSLNLLLSELDGEGLALPAFDSAVTFSTITNQARYTLGPAGTNAVRPETIIAATCTVTTNPVTKYQMLEMKYEDYVLIPVPDGTTGQPWNYAINQTYPQMEIFLYPTPNAVFPIILTCKVKWEDTLTAPSLNPFITADCPSGYPAALTDMLSLKLAETYRLETQTLREKADKARFLMTEYVYTQQRKVGQTMPVGLFPWTIGMAGRNPF